MPEGADVKERPIDVLPHSTEVVRRRSRIPLLVAAAALLALGFAVYRGIDGRTRTEATLAVTTKQDAVPTVEVLHPQPGAPDQELVLPGNTQAYTTAPIYARTNGYLNRWYFDIGAHVKQGDLLAEIDTPEVDEQLRQARADLLTAQANTQLAAVTAVRKEQLLKSQFASQQDRDNAAGALAADRAIEASRAADVARLERLQSYEKVYAPFDGIITGRNTDVGHLINAGAGAAAQLFDMAAIATLRIYVSVPEIDAAAIRVGETVVVTLDAYPGQTFHGSVARTGNSIDVTSRTLLVEVDLDNADGRLLPGAYSFVHFKLPAGAQSVTVPSNALLFRSEGLRAGVVRNGHAELVPIKIGRDYGDKVEVVSGLTAADQVILNPSDSLVNGAAVRVSEPAAKPHS
jgi:RND family efflux transporter MFP subunit